MVSSQCWPSGPGSYWNIPPQATTKVQDAVNSAVIYWILTNKCLLFIFSEYVLSPMNAGGISHFPFNFDFNPQKNLEFEDINLFG